MNRLKCWLLGHVWGKWITHGSRYTCDERWEERRCLRCGAIEEREW